MQTANGGARTGTREQQQRQPQQQSQPLAAPQGNHSARGGHCTQQKREIHVNNPTVTDVPAKGASRWGRERLDKEHHCKQAPRTPTTRRRDHHRRTPPFLAHSSHRGHSTHAKIKMQASKNCQPDQTPAIPPYLHGRVLLGRASSTFPAATANACAKGTTTTESDTAHDRLRRADARRSALHGATCTASGTPPMAVKLEVRGQVFNFPSDMFPSQAEKPWGPHEMIIVGTSKLFPSPSRGAERLLSSLQIALQSCDLIRNHQTTNDHCWCCSPTPMDWWNLATSQTT